ncbi:hypothetical protein N9758_02120 [Flavobacteriaceae bacterium]|nr:hypothetical protein [Flavobacteriaceae bacterium]MDC1363104.1 hypothetical protein [Flavobacteriaceae bacterium]|tara:strand:+ start:175 stop:594 length:420 start_codon:yes stop_codon:yes gene_type:complete
MNYKLVCTILALSLICFISCDRPRCNNKNLIFETFEPNSKKYKDELVAQLNSVDSSQLTYWLQKYDNQNGKETLYFNIQGDGLCAVLHLSVNHWNKLEHIRERKGIGRRGAEFTNLKFQIYQDSSSTDFVYISYDRLID